MWNIILKITHPRGKGWVTIDVLEIGESPNGKHFLDLTVIRL